MTETASAIFTLDELWLIQSVVRHEMAQQETWHQPPVSIELNDQVAQALLLCDEQKLTEAAILVTRHDCLVLDYLTPQSARSAAGTPIGKTVLLKSYRCRRALDEQSILPTIPMDDRAPSNIEEQMRTFEASYVPPRPAVSRRRRPKGVA